jgi:hypothetical protein
METANVTVAATQQELAVLEQLVPQEPKQIVLLQVVHIKVTIHHVPVTHVAAVVENVKQAIQLTVWGRASKILYTPTGLAIHIAMMVHTFLQIMGTAVLPA